ncbi:MAG TPA: Obg family GTPase CgtA, partial [Thermoleophilaceae bacterium]|nr:Obg family GTPase CgtA [Thermoleophilaceae bacterium]
APLDGSDPAGNHRTVEAELREHGHGLAELPRILCLSKADLLSASEVDRRVREWEGRVGGTVIATSAATGLGLDRLGDAIFERVPVEAPARARGDTPATHRVYRPGAADAFNVDRLGEGTFRVRGPGIERLIARHDVDNEEALRYVEERLRALGVIKALESAGFEPGDDVEIGGIVFELDPGAPFR